MLYHVVSKDSDVPLVHSSHDTAKQAMLAALDILLEDLGQGEYACVSTCLAHDACEYWVVILNSYGELVYDDSEVGGPTRNTSFWIQSEDQV